MHVKRKVTIPKASLAGEDTPFADNLDIIGWNKWSKNPHMFKDFRFAELEALGKKAKGYICSNAQNGELIYSVEHISGDDWFLVYNTQYVKREVRGNNKFSNVKDRIAL